MGLKKLFKRRSRNEVGKLGSSSSGKFDGSSHTEATHNTSDAASTASEASNSPKALLLESYAKNGKWDAVVKLVQESRADDWTTSSTATTTTTNDNNNSEPTCEFYSLHESSTPLHLAVIHHPPVTVIDKLVEASRSKLQVPIPEEAQDEQGRTPLHVAVAAGCDEETVVRLLQGDSIVMPAVVKDYNGQTALHAACAAPVVVTKKKNVFAANPVAMQKFQKLQVMSRLMKEHPEATYLEDSAGKTPVDYVKEMGLKGSVVKEMERVSKEYRADNMPKPPPRATANPHEMCGTLQHCDIPLIVPSASGSCRNFQLVCRLSLADVSDEGIQQEESSDVSTIGDNEVEMENLDCFGY